MNESLRTGCPCCSGTGRVSYEHCPGRNGPIDRDNLPSGHELDCYARKRTARIEYKRAGEAITSAGAQLHIRSELDKTHYDWLTMFVLVIDEGQTSPDDPCRFEIRLSHAPWVNVDGAARTTTLMKLGMAITGFVYGAPNVYEIHQTKDAA